MITLPRDGVRAFRAVLRKCSAPRSRGIAAPIRIEANSDGIGLTAATEEATLQWTTPNHGGEGMILLPSTVLELFEGGTESVQFIPKSRSRALVRWSERGAAKEQPIELLPPSRSPEPLTLPDHWMEMPSSFLQGLHEAGRMAAQGDGRYAIHRIQLQGAKGQILGTDAKQGLIQGGWSFPFTESVLVPAIPVFGCKELAEQPVRIGRTETHAVVQAGRWIVGLRIDATGRYPELDSAIPKAKGATSVQLSETDAAFLLDLLPQFPGRDEESAPITISVGVNGVTVLGQGAKDTKPAEVFLTGSKASGPPMSVALDRKKLIRCLALGCRRLRFPQPDQPFAAFGSDRTYLATVLDPALCIDPRGTATDPEPPSTEIAMPKPTPETEPTDLLTEAEQLRSAIYDVGQRISRIITILKSKKKDERALNQVFTSLKALQLGGPPR